MEARSHLTTNTLWRKLPIELQLDILELAANPIIINMATPAGTRNAALPRLFLPIGFERLTKHVQDSAQSPALRQFVQYMNLNDLHETVVGFDEHTFLDMKETGEAKFGLSGFSKVFTSQDDQDLVQSIIRRYTIGYFRSPSLLIYRISARPASARDSLQQVYLRFGYSELAALSAKDVAAIASLQLKTCIIEVVYRRSLAVKFSGKSSVKLCCRACIKATAIYKLAVSLRNCGKVYTVGDILPRDEKRLYSLMDDIRAGNVVLSGESSGVESLCKGGHEHEQRDTENTLIRLRPQRLLYRAKLEEQLHRAGYNEDQEDEWWW